jgi:hypothetical protein
LWARARARTPLADGGGNGSAGGRCAHNGGEASAGRAATEAALLAKRAYFATVDAEARFCTPKRFARGATTRPEPPRAVRASGRERRRTARSAPPHRLAAARSAPHLAPSCGGISRWVLIVRV